MGRHEEEHFEKARKGVWELLLLLLVIILCIRYDTRKGASRVNDLEQSGHGGWIDGLLTCLLRAVNLRRHTVEWDRGYIRGLGGTGTTRDLEAGVSWASFVVSAFEGWAWLGVG